MKIISQTLFLSLLWALAAIAYGETDGNKQGDESKSSVEEVTQEARDLIEALEAYGGDQREKAAERTEEALAKLDNRLEELQMRIAENWDEMSDAARRDASDALKDLREQRIELAERYGGWKESSASAWEDLKQGFVDAYRTLYDSWDRAMKEYASGSAQP